MQKLTNASKLNLTQINQIEWILNLIDAFPKEDLEQNNMRSIPEAALSKLSATDHVVSALIYTYDKSLSKFIKSRFWLFPNMLVLLPEEEDDDLNVLKIDQKQQILSVSKYLMLSSCFIDKKTIQYKESQALGMILHNSQGQCYLFFESGIQLIEWYTHLKRYCKMSNFLNKFTVKDRLSIPNSFTCIKNKTNRFYTVQIYRLADLQKNPSSLDALMNEIMILMSFKHPCLLTYLNLFEDQQHLYVLYEYWVGDALFRLCMQGLKLTIQQTALIAQQVFKLCRFLHQNQIYHGGITPQNIIILRTTEQTHKVVVFNFSFRDQNSQNYAWLSKRVPQNWIPPEIQSDLKYIDPLKIDSYLLGCTLHYMISFKPLVSKNKDLQFIKSVENFNIRYQDLLKMQIEQRSQFDGNGASQGVVDSHTFRSSELNLLIGLLNPDPSTRFDLEKACNHHWFINNMRKTLIQVEKFLPSLRTILELRETSSMDLNSYIHSQKNNMINDQEYDLDSHDNIHRISNEESFLFVFMQHLSGVTGIRHRRIKQGLNLQ